MRCFGIFLFILLCIKCINSNENHLASMVTDFSTLLRLANGLSIRTELLSGNLQISDVISDLLELDTGKSLFSLSEVDFTTIIEKLEISYQGLQKIDSLPSPDDFNFINPFTTEEEIEGSLKLFEKYGEKLRLASTYCDYDYFNTSYFKPLSEFLESLKNGKDYKTVKKKFSVIDAFDGTKLEFSNIKGYLSMETLTIPDNEIVGDVLKLVKISDFLNVLPLIGNETISKKDQKRLDKMIVLIGSLGSEKSISGYTQGFPRGGSDIKLMLKDLSAKWMQDELEIRQVSSMLKNSLSFLDSLPSDTQKIQEQWFALSDQSRLQMTATVIRTLQKVEEIEASLEKKDMRDFLSCSEQHLSGTKTKDDFEVFYKMTIQLREEVDKMKSFFRELNLLEGMKTEKYVKEDYVFEEMRGIVDSFKNETEKLQMLEMMKTDYSDFVSFADDLRQIVDRIPTYKKYEKYVKSNVENNPKAHMFTYETNYETQRLFFVECVNSTTSNFLKILENNWLGQEMKNLKSNLPAVTDYIKKVSVMQKTLSGVFKKYKKGLRSRRETHMPLWGAGSEHVRGFAKGVQILSHFSKVLEHEKDFETIAKSNDEVNAVIDEIPEVKSMWTSSYRKKIQETLKKVKILNTKAGKLRKNETRRFSDIFEEAHDIWGVPIDLKLLADKVVEILQNSSDSGAQEVAGSLQKVKDLQLDFSGYYLDLPLAKGSIESFWRYLDQIYGVMDDKKPVVVVRKWRRETTSLPPESAGTGIFFCIFIPSLLLLFLIVCCSLRWIDNWKWRKQQELEDPVLCSRYLAFQEEKFTRKEQHVRSLLQAVENDDLASASLFVEQGAWIDALHDTQTCLHIAATLTLNPSMVSLLIRHGANRRALNRNYRTAWEEVEEEIATCQDILSLPTTKGRKRKEAEQRVQKLKAVDSVFLRFERRRFERIFPDLMPTSEFRIYVDYPCSVIPELYAFTKKFPNLMTQNLGEATHVIVETTNGAFEMKINDSYHWVFLVGRSMLIDGSAWLKACLKKNEKALRNDYKYRIKQVKIGESFHSTNELAHRDWHMRVVPILQDVVIIGDDLLKAEYYQHGSDVLKELFKSLGATWHDEFPSLVKYNHKITKPYHYFDKPLFWRPVKSDGNKTNVFYEMDWHTLIRELLERKYRYDPDREPRKTVLRMDGDPVQETSETLKKMKKVVDKKKLKDQGNTEEVPDSLKLIPTE